MEFKVEITGPDESGPGYLRYYIRVTGTQEKYVRATGFARTMEKARKKADGMARKLKKRIQSETTTTYRIEV